MIPYTKTSSWFIWKTETTGRFDLSKYLFHLRFVISQYLNPTWSYYLVCFKSIFQIALIWNVWYVQITVGMATKKYISGNMEVFSFLTNILELLGHHKSVQTWYMSHSELQRNATSFRTDTYIQNPANTLVYVILSQNCKLGTDENLIN